jgi:hypothetical protein
MARLPAGGTREEARSVLSSASTDDRRRGARSRFSRHLLLAAALASAACGAPEAPAARRAPAAPVVAAADSPAAWSPARWDYHPPAPDGARAHLRLDGGACVVVAPGGQRWLTTPARARDGGEARRCAGVARASASLAPEDLVNVVRRGASSWIFVGESGTLYEAAEPLGPLARATPPPEPVVKVVGGPSALVALTRAGRLLRYDAATGFTAAAAPPALVVDVAVNAAGRGLALAAPEALFTSDDGGATWIAARAASSLAVGAARVGDEPDGALIAEGLLESVVWDPSSGADPARAPRTLAAPAPPALEAGRAASAAAVLYGRAQIDEDRYWEALRPDAESGPWELARGRIEGRLETIPLAWSDACGSLKLGARGKHVVVACVRLEGDDVVATVRRSSDGGATWKTLADLPAAETDQVAIAVAPDGSALVTGACKPAQADCRPEGPIVLRAPRVVASLAPGLGGSASAPAFSPDGRSAYVIGRRAKDDAFALFVSHDAGESFAERSLDRPEGAARAASGEEAEDPIELELGEGTSIQVADDGTVGVTFPNAAPPVHFVADADGRVTGLATTPTREGLLAGHGRSLVALATREAGADEALRFGAPASGEGFAIGLWESLDGGGTWAEVPIADAVGADYQRGSTTIACGAGGCLFGETASRVGWGGGAEGQRRALAAPEVSIPRASHLRTPIACELAVGSRWTRVERLEGRAGQPDIDEAARGRSLWSLLTFDPATAAVTAVSAMRPASGPGASRVEARRLLAPLSRPARAATHIAPQMEGYAAVRARLGEGGAPTGRLEVAWENWMEGTSGRRELEVDGGLDDGAVLGARLATGLVSVSPGGVFLRPRPSSRRLVFLDLKQGVERLDYPDWPASGPFGDLQIAGGGDAVMARGQIVAVGFVTPGDGPRARVVMLGRRAPGDAWSFSATSLSPLGGIFDGELEWTYAGRELGVTSLMADPFHGRAWAFFSPFLPDGTFGAPVALPTQLDLGERPRACDAAERASTARMESVLFGDGDEPLYAGTRHPVLVDDPAGPKGAAASEPTLLLTSSAVVHGTPAAPCVAALRALGAGKTGTRAILSGDLTDAWLFRDVDAPPEDKDRAADAQTSGRALEYRPMTCRYAPAARIPDAAWREPGVWAVDR